MKKDIERSVDESIQQQKLFNSPTYGKLTFKEVVYQIGAFMHDAPHADYEIVFGTDSQKYADRVDFVTAVIVHRFKQGGIFFWRRFSDTKTKYVLRDRMYQEAVHSMNFARQFMNEFETEGIIRFNLEIHVDIGNRGKTRTMINEVVGMVKGNGFEVKTKPQAYGAASVADRYT